MSDINIARHSETQVVFGGVDITVFLNKGYMSLTYTDNEEDEADDLQIKVHDRDRKWSQKWLNEIVSSAAIGGDIISSVPSNSTGGSSGTSSSSSSTKSSDTKYKVTASTGVNIRKGAGEKYAILGKLPYGAIVDVHTFHGTWAKIT